MYSDFKRLGHTGDIKKMWPELTDREERESTTNRRHEYKLIGTSETGSAYFQSIPTVSD